MCASPRVAFFDLDYTLLDHNSGVLYARDAYARGYLSRFDLVRSMVWAGLHYLGRLDVEETFRRAGALFAGLEGEHVRSEVQRWFTDQVAQRLRPGGRRALARHRAAGERTVLITNSSSYIAEAAAHAWGLDAYLANDIQLDAHGRITGEVARPLCYGPGKVLRAQRWCAAHGLSLEPATFYSDSLADLPLLERVASPQVVHPDPRLRRVAVRRGWTIHDWS